MTVIQILPALEQGGVESVVLSLNRVVVKSGRRSIVISSGGKLAAEIERDGGRHVQLDVKSKNPLTYFQRVSKLRETLRRIAADIGEEPLVCVHSRVPAWLFMRANRELGFKWITYAHGANSVSKYSEVMTKGDLTVVPSRFLAGFLKENYPITDEKLRIVYPTVDFDRFNPRNLDKEFIREKRRVWRVLPGEKVSMAVGRITPVKGLDAVVRDTYNKLIIVGDAEDRHQDYLGELKRLASGKDVVFAGGTDKVAECLSIADEVISGNVSKPESFGLSIAEAYAMNKPVVAKSFGGAKEIMDFVRDELVSGRAKDRREAIKAMCDFDIMYRKTLEIYDSLQ